MRKAFAIVVPALALSVLAGCGDSSTATNDSTSTPVVAASTSATASTSSEVSASTSTTPSTAPEGAGAAGGAAAAPAPQAPVEVSGIPTPERPENEKAFLAEIDKAGIKVDGIIADQVVAAGRRHCEMERTGQEDLITPAVAGQLVELDKTDLTPQQAQDAIVAGARSQLCR